MLGCDIVEIERIKKAVSKWGNSFVERILTVAETELYKNRGCKGEFLAGRFAAKEAVSKAIGCGIGKELSFVDIEVIPNSQGKPEVALKGEKRDDIFLSISHSRDNAMAVCFIKGML
ncbi:MAG: holo-ACP synthase [Deferribacterales bacterium]|nr:holo-ACP synthase [Deferribacterales bacterium]